MARVKVGGKIKMTGERHRYTVQALDERFSVLTKPFNAQKTYLYCFTDLVRGLRGPCNFIFGLPFIEEVNTPEGAELALRALQSGEMEISYRRNKKLTTDEVEQLQSQTKD